MRSDIGWSGWAGLAFALALAMFAPDTSAGETTALDLVKEGNRYVGEQAKDKVVEIRSEKSIGGLDPAIWRIVYFDPTATFKSVEVKFGAGKMLDVKRPFRLLEPITGKDEPLDMSKVKIDSNKAIQTALAEPLLEKLTVKATSAKLVRGDGGVPVWKIRVWAAKLREPNEQADLGEVTLSAEDGKVIKNGLRIKRVD
jgi:hypothetical protein